MRVLKLVLVGTLAFVIALVVLFPAAPVVARIEPELGPVALEGVGGKLWSGRIDRVRSTDDLLPLEFENVGWRLAPTALPGGGGATVDFEAYGGAGEGLVRRTWGGDLVVEDFRMNARAKALEPLLPAPIAAFDGAIEVDISSLVIRDDLLRTFEGEFVWRNAVLERPIRANFGTVSIALAPAGEGAHAGKLAATGGDVEAEGDLSIATDGDFTLDLLVTPTADAPRELVDSLARVARQEAGGRYRIRQAGNVNRLM